MIGPFGQTSLFEEINVFVGYGGKRFYNYNEDDFRFHF